jgi:hypothetical protein
MSNSAVCLHIGALGYVIEFPKEQAPLDGDA